MLRLLNDTWPQIQSTLRDKVGAAGFEAWLGELRPIAMERGICHLQAKNKLVCDQVQRLYQTVIEDVLSDELATRVSINVVAQADPGGIDRLEVGPTLPVVDESNRQAFLVLRALLEQREMPSRQFVFYGPSGVGKTFLLRWFCMQNGERDRFFVGDGIVRAMQACLRDGRLDAFREELQRDQPLVIDELHRLAGHKRLQRELVRVLEYRAENVAAPVLIASRWHPREIWRAEPTFVSHLMAGFVCGIDYPGPTARLRYLRALEGAPSRNGRADAIEGLARNLRGSYFDLRRAWATQREGADGVSSYLRLIEPRSVFKRMQERVMTALAVTEEELAAKSQSRRLSFARQILAYLCVQEGLSRAEVGRYLGGRSRAAISYSIKALERRMGTSEDVRMQVEALL